MGQPKEKYLTPRGRYTSRRAPRENRISRKAPKRRNRLLSLSVKALNAFSMAGLRYQMKQSLEKSVHDHSVNGETFRSRVEQRERPLDRLIRQSGLEALGPEGRKQQGAEVVATGRPRITLGRTELGLAVGPSARDPTRDTGTGNLEQYGTNGDITTSGLASEYSSQEYDLLRLDSRRELTWA